MELRQVRYFIAVSEELHVGRAAEKLNITQPPLTRQIKQLEAELDVMLFRRTPKGMELTLAGDAFLHEARIILKHMTKASYRAKLAQAGKVGRLDIGYYGSPIFNIIPNILKDFHKQHPQVEVGLQHMTKMGQIEALKDKMIQVGFSRSIPETPGILIERVCKEPLMLATPSHSAMAELTEISIEDLAATPLILFPAQPRPSFADEVFNICKNAGFHPNVAMEAEDAATCVNFVASGFGAALVPRSVSALKVDGVSYVKLMPENLTTELSCIHNKYNHNPITDAFLEIVKAYK